MTVAVARKGAPVSWAVVLAAAVMTLMSLVCGLAWDVMQGRFDGLGGEAPVSMVGAVFYMIYAGVRQVRRHQAAFLAGLGGFFAVALLGWALSNVLPAALSISLDVWAALIGPAMVAAFVAVTRIGGRDEASPPSGQPAQWRPLMLLAAAIGLIAAVAVIVWLVWRQSPGLFSSVAAGGAVAVAAGIMVVGAANGVRRARAALIVGFAAGFAGLFGGAALAAALLPEHLTRPQSAFGVIQAVTALLMVAAFTAVTRAGAPR